MRYGNYEGKYKGKEQYFVPNPNGIINASAYFFVKQYGLLGFMVDIPINTDFILMDEVTLKEDNFISKNCIMKTKDYFKLFFPFATADEMSCTVTNGKVVIKSTFYLQEMLKQSSLSNQLIYSNFYCEKVEWIVEYANLKYLGNLIH